MRRVAQREDIEHFITALGREATNPTRLYFTGGATAVLLGWRASTIDVDIHILPEDDRLLRTLPELKESLELYPAIDPLAFRRAVEQTIADLEKS
jgi:hypothetical protein